jgi:Uncharacterized phage-associated protein
MANLQKVADFFLDVANKDEEDIITNARLNKLMYFAQAYSLARNGIPLFKDEIKAWKLGPVVPEIYHKYKEYGSSRISGKYAPFDPDAFTEEEYLLLLDVVREYGKYSTPTLINISHEPGSPWEYVYCRKQGGVIDKDAIKDYYRKKASLKSFDGYITGIPIIEGRRDLAGALVLPAELENDWKM